MLKGGIQDMIGKSIVGKVIMFIRWNFLLPAIGHADHCSLERSWTECWSGCGGGSRSVTLVPLSVVARTRPSHTPGCMAGWGEGVADKGGGGRQHPGFS